MSSELVPRAEPGSVDLTYKDFRANRAAGNLSLYGQIADAAAEKICGLYGKSPASLVRIIPFGTGLIDNSRGVFDDLCKDIAPPPALPAPPFSGGQCDAVRYNVKVRVTYNQIYGEPPTVHQTTQDVDDTVWGPIGGVSLSNPGTYSFLGVSVDGYATVRIACRGYGYDGIKPPGFYSPYGRSDFSIASAVLISAVRVDSLADNCGNPPATYPPPSTDPSDYDGTTNITISPTTIVNVPVRIVPTFAPVIGIFRPEFNVNVGGINVNFSAGGLTFSPTLEIPVGVNLPGSDPRTNPPTALPITKPSAGTCPDVNLQPVLDQLDIIKKEVEECCDRYHPFSDLLTSDYDVQTLGSGSSGVFNLHEKAYRVVLTITNPEAKGRSQGGGLAPEVLYAGWAWFKSGGGMLDRAPIDSPIKAFDVPARCDGTFAFTLNGIYNANVICYFSKK